MSDLCEDKSFDDITILLQGVVHADVDLNMILCAYTKYCPVILSIYDTDYETVQTIAREYKNVTIVQNNFDEFIKDQKERKLHFPSAYHNNAYYQIRTTLAGLEHVHTSWVLKSRVDHFYEGLDDFINTGFTMDKVISSSLFVRGHKMRYHYSDCLFMARTEPIQNTFLLAERNYKAEYPEMLIWSSYFTLYFQEQKIAMEKLSDQEYYEWVDKHLYVYGINKFPSFRIKVMNKVITSSKDCHRPTVEYLQHGCNH